MEAAVFYSRDFAKQHFSPSTSKTNNPLTYDADDFVTSLLFIVAMLFVFGLAIFG